MRNSLELKARKNVGDYSTLPGLHLGGWGGAFAPLGIFLNEPLTALIICMVTPPVHYR